MDDFYPSQQGIPRNILPSSNQLRSNFRLNVHPPNELNFLHVTTPQKEFIWKPKIGEFCRCICPFPFCIVPFLGELLGISGDIKFRRSRPAVLGSFIQSRDNVPRCAGGEWRGVMFFFFLDRKISNVGNLQFVMKLAHLKIVEIDSSS